MTIIIRRARSEPEISAAGRLTAEAYQADRLVTDTDDYTSELLDAARRSREAILLVALDDARVGEEWSDEEQPQRPSPIAEGTVAILGTLTMAPFGTTYAEVADPGELEVRMLAVEPVARGKGIAESLMRATLREAVLIGTRRVVLSTMDAMQAAQRLYERLGFERAPERDWAHEEVHLRVYTWEPPQGPGVRAELATWPPVEGTRVAGFEVGTSGGLTRRANSAVLANEDSTSFDLELAQRVEEVERVFAEAGLPSVFRVDRAHGCAQLDALLDERGYLVVTPTVVMVRDAGSGELPPAEHGIRLTQCERPDDEWLEVWLRGSGRATTRLDLARAVLTGAPAVYLSARHPASGSIIGVLRVALAQGASIPTDPVWSGLSCLAVDPLARRRGVGRMLAVAGVVVAGHQGASRVFMQVVEGNDAAFGLYESLGFEPAEYYVYRER